MFQALKNRHFRLWLTRRAHQRRVDGPSWGVWIGAAGLFALYPSFNRVFWFSLNGPATGWDSALSGVAYRMALGIFGLSAIDIYSRMVRSNDRDVIDLLPVSGGSVVQGELMRLVVQRAWCVPALAVLALPVASHVGLLSWLQVSVFLLGVHLCSLGAVAAAFGTSVHVAISPKYAAVLDAARGANAREQAAFIYAPGAALCLFGSFYGFVVSFISSQPDLTGFLVSLLPLLLAPFVWGVAIRRAEHTWAITATLLAEIDARYAALEEATGDQSVYLDWALRGLPPSVQRWALLDLRNGWRAHRSFISAGWLLGAITGIALWGAAPSELPFYVMLTAGAIWLLGVSAYFLDRDEPVFLKMWLHVGGASRSIARAVVVFLWAQSGLLQPTASALLRHDGWFSVLLALECSALISAIASAFVLPRYGLAGYLGLGLAIASAAVTLGGL